jgi:hypothetical protein
MLYFNADQDVSEPTSEPTGDVRAALSEGTFVSWRGLVKSPEGIRSEQAKGPALYLDISLDTTFGPGVLTGMVPRAG